MGYVERRNALQILRNDAEHDDFIKRPFWDWSTHAVFAPVFHAMQGAEFEELPERFRRCCKIMVGGTGLHEVYTDLHWDFHETKESINKMLKRMGTDLQCMLKACYKGLRVKGTSSPVLVPPTP